MGCAQMLYTASGRAPSHLYMLLIILLILTQDASFAANVHKVQLTSVPWYKERLLNRTSLGAHPLLPFRPLVVLPTAHGGESARGVNHLGASAIAQLASKMPGMLTWCAYSQSSASAVERWSRAGCL
jgi:hypothetical protein